MILVVDGQRIYNYEYQEPPPIASNSLGFIDVEFRLSEEWDGYICTAQFVQHKEDGTDFIASKALYNNHVTFPDGIIPGVLEISLFGYKAGEAERGTTFPYIQPVYRSGFTSTEATPVPPTPDLYSQFLESLETTKQSIENDKQTVQNASKDAITARDDAVKAAKTAVAAAKDVQSNLDSIESNTKQAITAIQTEGNTQRSFVTSTGDAQNQRVMDTGVEQSRALSTQGDVEQRKVIAAGDEQVSRVTNAGNGAVESVTLEKTNAINDVQNTKTEAVNSVESAKTTAVEAIKSAESAAIQNIGTGVDDTLSMPGKAADAKKTGDSISSLKEDLGDVAIKDSDRLNLYDGVSYRQGYYDGSKWTTFGKSLIIASGLVKYNDRLTFSEDALIGSTYYTMCIDDEDNILARPQNDKNTIAFTNSALNGKKFSVYVRVPEDYDISKFIAVIGSKIPDTWTLGEKVNFSLKDRSVTHDTIADNTIETKNIKPKAVTANCTSFLYENSIINNIYDGTTYKNGHWDGSKWVDWGTTKSLKINLGLVQFRDNLCVSVDSAVNGTYSVSMFDKDDTFIHQTANTSNVLSITNAKLQNKTFYCYIRVPIEYDISSFIAIIGDNIPTGYGLNDVTKVYEQSLPKYLQRKSLVIDCLGDSFTAPSTAWHDYLRKKTGWKILNHGVSSSRISIDKKVTGELDTDGNVINKTVLSFLNRVSDIDINADAVIIFGGINDAYSINDGSITIGAINSELDTTTFYGALKKLIVDIRNKMPSKKIIGVIPPDFMPTESYINTLPLVQDACRKVYRFYGIPFADLKYDCQEMYESDYNNSTYRLVTSTVDNYHPSDLGHEAIAKTIYKTVSGIIDF